MFSASERVLYGKRQLIEVICQLRFPTILSISAKEPAEFQEAIRAEFPRYARNLEKLPPKVIGQPGAMKLEEQPTVVNYQFLTAAGDWKVNLTNTFLALATPVYTTWEDFARKLDEVLATKPLTVACGEGAVQLLNVVPEGKKPMDGTAFAAGQRLKTGDIL